MTKTRPFLSTCYGYPSTTEVPPCCQAATTKLTFSTTSVLLLLNVPLSLSRGTVFRRQKNPRRGYRPKIAGILFVCNEPEGKYYTVPDWIKRPPARSQQLPYWITQCSDQLGAIGWASALFVNIDRRSLTNIYNYQSYNVQWGEGEHTMVLAGIPKSST